jgi:hypothetical protein
MNWSRAIIWIICFGMGVIGSAIGMDGHPYYAASMVIAAMGFLEVKP